MPAVPATLKSLKSALRTQRVNLDNIAKQTSEHQDLNAVSHTPNSANSLSFSSRKEAKAYYRSQKKQNRDELRTFIRSLRSQHHAERRDRRGMRHERWAAKRALKREAKQLKRAIKKEKRQRKREIKRAARRDHRQAKREGKMREQVDGIADRFESTKEQRRVETDIQDDAERRRKEEEDEYFRKVEAKGREMAADDARRAQIGMQESGVVEDKARLN